MSCLFKRLRGLVFLASCLLLPGCLSSPDPILIESAGVVVPDLSGAYTSRMAGYPVLVSWEGNNRFSVKRDDNEPEEAILVPLDAPGAYLMQFYDGEDYSLSVILVKEDQVVVSVFAAAVQDAFGSAFAEGDHFRQLAAALLANKLKAILEKHGLEVDQDYALLNRPTPETLVAFFNECVREPGTLTDSEALLKKK